MLTVKILIMLFIILCYKYFVKISFLLCPAHSRVDRGNLVLRHAVTHFPPNSGVIASELNAALTPEQNNGNIN